MPDGGLKPTLLVRSGTTVRVDADVIAVEPILTVPDVPAAVGWWTSVLGATGGWEWRENPDAAVTHGGCSLGRASLQFSRGDVLAAGTALFFTCGFTSADGLDAYAAAVGDAVTRPPRDEAWGFREFHVADPQGRLLRFAGPTTRPKPRREPAGFRVEERKPTGEEWATLISAVGWADSSPLDWAAEVVSGASHGVVAVAGGQIVGCVLLLSNGVNQAYFSDVAVLPDWQGRGVGELMMRAALRWCGDNLEPTAVLALSTGRGTAPFYERLGFRGGDEGGGYGMSRRNRPAR